MLENKHFAKCEQTRQIWLCKIQMCQQIKICQFTITNIMRWKSRRVLATQMSNWMFSGHTRCLVVERHSCMQTEDIVSISLRLTAPMQSTHYSTLVSTTILIIASTIRLINYRTIKFKIIRAALGLVAFTIVWEWLVITSDKNKDLSNRFSNIFNAK